MRSLVQDLSEYYRRCLTLRFIEERTIAETRHSHAAQPGRGEAAATRSDPSPASTIRSIAASQVHLVTGLSAGPGQVLATEKGIEDALW
jgi:hypothetical protein